MELINYPNTETIRPLQKEGRNYGIDALKIISMFMVLILHILGAGGILDATKENSLNYHIGWFMEVGAYCAVNLFALTTGYLMVGRKWRIGRIIDLWLQVVFYSAGITLIFGIINPSYVSAKFLLKSFFPVFFKLWWYFTAYFGLFFFIPFLNKLMEILTKRQTFILTCVLIILFSIIDTARPGGIFSTENGYSLVWLIALYILGGAIKKYNLGNNTKKRWFALLYIGSLLAGWLSRIIIGYLSTIIFGERMYENVFISYTSPITLLMAVGLLLFFVKARFPECINKIVEFISPLSFAVYIIHQQRFFLAEFFVEKFAYLANKNAFVLVGTVLAAASIVFGFCIAVEWLRVFLFKKIGITKGIKKLGGYIDKKIDFYKGEK